MAGESLAILDSAELQDHVLQGRAFLNEAIIRLDELKAGSRPQELEQARANVRHAYFVRGGVYAQECSDERGARKTRVRCQSQRKEHQRRA